MNGDSPILYLEDEETDVLLMSLALKRSGLPNPLRVAVNALEAINYLTGVGSFRRGLLCRPQPASAPLPCAPGFEYADHERLRSAGLDTPAAPVRRFACDCLYVLRRPERPCPGH